MALDGVLTRVTPRVFTHLASGNIRHRVVYLTSLNSSDARVAIHRRWLKRYCLTPVRATRRIRGVGNDFVRFASRLRADIGATNPGIFSFPSVNRNDARCVRISSGEKHSINDVPFASRFPIGYSRSLSPSKAEASNQIALAHALAAAACSAFVSFRFFPPPCAAAAACCCAASLVAVDVVLASPIEPGRHRTADLCNFGGFNSSLDAKHLGYVHVGNVHFSTCSHKCFATWQCSDNGHLPSAA